jgi:hypothetical protein
MKSLNYICFLAIIVFFSSCTKSQFSTSTRQTKNGKVSYVNSYHNEKLKLSKNKAAIKGSTLASKQTLSVLNSRTNSTNEIIRIDPISLENHEILIASTTKEPIFLQNTSSHFVQTFNNTNSTEKKQINKTTMFTLDTIKGHEPKGGAKVTDTRKTEKLGLTGFILSLVGWVLIYGSPLCILGIVFGAISLGKIKRNPKKYKGKGFAIASLILGIVGLAIIIAYAASQR